MAAKKGAAETSPTPTDRGKPGTKRPVAVDRAGTPFGLTLCGANRYGNKMLSPTLDAVQGIREGRGCHAECPARSNTPRIARRCIESSQKLGRHRWVVERTLAWLSQF